MNKIVLKKSLFIFLLLFIIMGIRNNYKFVMSKKNRNYYNIDDIVQFNKDEKKSLILKRNSLYGIPPIFIMLLMNYLQYAYKIPLSVYLIGSYSNNNITGVTDSSYNYAVISISAAHPFNESFFHESYHYIERFLFKRGANFNTWNSINPNGFTYGVIDQRLSYTYGFNANSPFVNDYAQSSAEEDRASTFEYMMASSKASCLNNGTIVHEKAMQMALTMDVVLNTVSPNVTEYWERYL